MPSEENHKVPQGLYANKGICTESAFSQNTKAQTTSTDSESVSWRSPCRLKEEVQTIIDIMGPPIKQFSSFNTSSEADNEESIFTNSKVSTSAKHKPLLEFDNNPSENTNDPTNSKDETNMSVISVAADNNTSRISDLETLPFDQRCPYPTYPLPQYICPPPLLPANLCVNSECMCPQVASVFNAERMATATHSHNRMPVPVISQGVISREINRESRRDMRRGNYAENTFNGYFSTDPTRKPKSCLRRSMVDWLKTKIESFGPRNFETNYEITNCEEYYKMNIKKSRKDDKSPPRKVVFKLIPGGIPKGTSCENCALKDNPRCSQKFYFNAKPDKSNSFYCDKTTYKEEDLQKTPGKEEDFQDLEQINTCQTNDCCDKVDLREVSKSVGRTTYLDPSGNTRVDVYYFDHGNSTHFKTTDSPPIVATEELSERIDRKATRYWAEVFGAVHIGVSFITSFVLQLLRFILYSILRPLTIGTLQLVSDYFFKPLLATLFNGVLQPILIFCYNIATSIRDLLDPLAEGVGYFIRELAVLVGSFRLFQKIENCSTCRDVDCKCKKPSKKCNNKETNC